MYISPILHEPLPVKTRKDIKKLTSPVPHSILSSDPIPTSPHDNIPSLQPSTRLSLLPPSPNDPTRAADTMDLDPGASSSTSSANKVSTHGPRNSRREQWRASKGLPARPRSRGMNRQVGVAAKRKAGRSHRRR